MRTMASTDTVTKKTMTSPAQTVPPAPNDDVVTVCAISMLAGMLAAMAHEGIGHGLVALLTGVQSGVLSTVAWSSAVDSRLVAAGGTLVNLAAGLVFWIWLRNARKASPPVRFFLLMTCAFNLFTGTGYFFFSGVTNFGDWAVVIAGMHPHWLWRALLIVFGVAAYYGAVVIVGSGLVRYVGVLPNAKARMRKLMVSPYVTAIVLSCAAALFNPVGMQLLWQSALPATAGANSGLLWLRHYIPKGSVPERGPEGIGRSYAWIVKSTALVNHYYFYCVDRDFGPFFLSSVPTSLTTPSSVSTGTSM